MNILEISKLNIFNVPQDCEELNEWIIEKKFTAQDETYRSAKTVHSKWTRHQAFEAEIASNKNRLLKIKDVISHLCFGRFSRNQMSTRL